MPGKLSRVAAGEVRDATIVPLTVGVVVGIAAAVAAATLGSGPLAALIGWDVTALTYLTWIWLRIGKLDAQGTKRHAVRVDPTRAASDLLLLAASAASLVAVVFVMVRASHAHGAAKAVQTALGLASVVVGWLVVHTTYMLRYATLYHADSKGGVDFNQEAAPCYLDFAYLAFTIGMTFQVSDTPLTSSAIRANALRHALLSYLYGTVIIAAAINLVVGLSR